MLGVEKMDERLLAAVLASPFVIMDWAQRLDVADQLARRVAGTTDPELAVEAVRGGAGRRHRLG
jgi:hypothetical protein